MSQDQSQEKLMEFQMLQQQFEQMQKYIEELNMKLMEFSKTKETLEEMKKVKGENEVFVPIAQGIFAKATVSNTSELLVNIGANTAVVKDVPDILSIIEKQINDVTEIKDKLETNMTKLTTRLNAVVSELQAFS